MITVHTIQSIFVRAMKWRTTIDLMDLCKILYTGDYCLLYNKPIYINKTNSTLVSKLLKTNTYDKWTFATLPNPHENQNMDKVVIHI